MVREFWGSGNKGASILRSITTPDGTNTWNGQTGTSVKMESMYAVIKFAAEICLPVIGTILLKVVLQMDI